MHKSSINEIYYLLEERIKKQDERLADLIVRYEMIESKLNSLSLEEKLRKNMSVFKVTDEIAFTPVKDKKDRSIDTSKKVLLALLDRDMTAIDVMRLLGCSREHAARLMKQLKEKGLVNIVNTTKPYVYRITHEGKTFVQS